MYRRSKTILISGGITIITTIIILLLFFKDWFGVSSIAAVTIIWSEIVFFGGLIFAEWISKRTEQIIVRSSIYITVFVYAIANILISVLFILELRWFVKSFIAIELILLAIAAIIILISVSVGSNVANSNAHIMESVNNMERIVGRLDKLVINPDCREFSPKIKKLSDNLRFTDCSKIVPEDIEIDKVVGELEILAGDGKEVVNEEFDKKLVNLKELIAKRKIALHIRQKGKI